MLSVCTENELKPSLYGQYLREKTEDCIIEEDYGFATYRYLDNGECYIIDIYVVPERRGEGVGTGLANRIAREAKERGCKKLVGTVVPSMKNPTAAAKTMMFSYGMQIDSAQVNMIIFKKDL